MRREKGTSIVSYRPKALVDGSMIGQAAGSSWVAVPDKFAGKPVVVVYAGAQMTIRNWKTEAVLYRRFRDKFWTQSSNRSQYYTLGYFKFVPDVA